ncbi:Histidinol-phosphatase [Crateriforma conspicua]|uniref:Histidinol-phosphatase n=1 Tax=Crateriforma conspicua TaxID=2527996 RepID=A0A5C6FV94_9PLAN|nr:inositol monophosphatase family protein [Crateriforma conspicua]TWU65003.1 Histidinol-phosphatase [Crateriforma conspicua]
MNDPRHWTELHEGRLTAMIDIAIAAGRHTLRYYQADDLDVIAKSDDSPVTVADREAEQLTRRLVGERFADDTIQGEEFPNQEGTSAYRWTVDPIDGTKSFVCGVPLYSTLLALEMDGQPLGGVIFIPALGEIAAAAIGHGCWHASELPRGADATTVGTDLHWASARVSKKDDLGRSVFVTSQVDSFAEQGAAAAYQSLEKQAWITRTWGDGYGYLLVATGRADLMVDPICNAWDVAAVLPVVVEAGGRFTDWSGQVTAQGGNGLGTNGMIHDAVLKHLAG